MPVEIPMDDLTRLGEAWIRGEIAVGDTVDVGDGTWLLDLHEPATECVHGALHLGRLVFRYVPDAVPISFVVRVP